MSGNEFDLHLRPLFLKEAGALLGHIEALLLRWQADPQDASACRLLSHKLHTLKGLSHTVGAHGFALQVQQMELAAKDRHGRIPDRVDFAHLAAGCRDLQHHFLRLKDPARSGLEVEAVALPVTPELLVRRMDRAAGQAAQEVGKRVRLEILGEPADFPATVLEILAGPLEHLVRNAVVHGIEAPGDRVREGKPAQGAICLEFREQAAHWQISVSDDGAGVDYAAVAERARQQGCLAADADPEPARLHECLFRPGFSTAATVTTMAGLGVGLDAVKAAVSGLGGDIEIESRPGAGTRFILCLPRAAA